MFEPKVPALFAAAGFVLSFLIGLVSGVPLSLIVIRAILMAFFFAVLAGGVLFLLKKFLPELLDLSSSSVSDFDSDQRSVDITIEDPPFDISSSESENESFNSEMTPDFITSSEKSQKSGILSEDTEFNSNESDSIETNSTESVSNEVIHSEEKESTGFIPGIHISPAEVKNKPVHSVDGLDVLPDLQDFVSPAVATKDVSAEESDSFDSSVRREGNAIFSDIESGSSSKEAATMAKAIRTILAREK